MVQIEGVSKSYGERELFSDVTFHVGSGERCAIIGRNGSGKTTLLKILAGLVEADSGTIRLPKGTGIGTLPQHIRFTEPTILDEAILGLPEDQRLESYRAEIILSGLGISEEDFDKPPSGLSGGYQLRLSLCKVLVGEPALLLLDEPTNYLDVVSIRWLKSFLKNWKGQLLFISHDRTFVNTVCTHVIGIKRGKAQKLKGDLDHYENHIALQEETHERTREKLEKKKAHLSSFVERFGAKATKAAQAQSKMKAIEKMGSMEALEKEQLLDFQFRYEKVHNKVLAGVKKLCFSYQPQKPLIEEVAFEIENQERVAIIGKNGRGKSTLLRLIAGELQPVDGAVEMGKNTRIAYFGQTNIDRLNPARTIEEELQASSPDSGYGEIRGACGAMLFSGDDAKKSISVLSGGEKSRVLLAKILLTPANLLLLDEPTHHLDMESVDALIHAVRTFPGSVILVSHDENVLDKFQSGKIVVCREKGQHLFLGSYGDFLEREGWEAEEKTSGTAPKQANKLDRRERAELVRERSQALKPLKKEMNTLMRAVEKLEKEKAGLEASLLEESENPSGRMGELTEKHGKLVKDLEGNYEKLEELMMREEEINAQFE